MGVIIAQIEAGEGINASVSTRQINLAGLATVENTDVSYQDTVESGNTLVIPDITLTKNDNTTVSAVAAIDLDLGVIDPAADANVENTDVSYSDTVASGGTLVIPDINITKNDDSVVTSPAAIDLDLRIIDPSTSIPATWDEFVAEYGRGYSYPRPSPQATSYRTGDVVDIENTVFGATNRNAQTLKARNTIASFLVLNNNNSFGNTNRITDELGTQAFTNGLRIDHITGLMFYDAAIVAADWNTQIDAALASTQGGYSDWFMASNEQLISISDPQGETRTVLTLGGNRNLMWISDTSPSVTTSSFQWYGFTRLFKQDKTTTSHPMILCRKHF